MSQIRHHRRLTPGLVLAMALVLTVTSTACGTTEPDASEDAQAHLAAYDLVTGERQFTLHTGANGTMGFGEAMRAALGSRPGAAAALAQDTPVSMDVTMQVTQTITDDPAGNKVSVTVDDVDGHVKAFGTDQDVDQGMLAKAGSGDVTYTYTMKPDGTADAVSGNPLGGTGLGTFTGASMGGGCPKLPAGGVEPGQTWTVDQPVPIAGMQASIPSTNTYTVEGDTATVTSKATGPMDVTVDFSEFAKNSPSLAGAGNLAGVKMRMSGTVDMTSTCTMTVPGQELESVESNGHLKVTMAFSGTAANPQLKQFGEGEFLHMDMDVSSSLQPR